MSQPNDDLLRRWRRKAHRAFDRKWRGKEKRTKRWAFEWLAAELGLESSRINIDAFDIQQCSRIVRLCSQKRKEG